jgi:hypothetical protein
MISLSVPLRMRSVSNGVEKSVTSLSENRAIYDNVQNCCGAGEARQYSTAHALGILDKWATNTLSEYLIRTYSLSTMQWLHERD